MADPLMFLEQPFDLQKHNCFYVDVVSQHPKARVLDVMSRIDRDDEGRPVREYGVLLIKDRGHVGRLPKERQRVVVVRSRGPVTGLPSDVGEFVARFYSDYGAVLWFVFLETPEARARTYAPSPSEPAPPPPPPATSTASPPASKPAPPSEGDDSLW